MATCTSDYPWCHGEDSSDGHRRLHHGDNLASFTPAECYLYAADGETAIYVADVALTEHEARDLRASIALAIRLGFPPRGSRARLRRWLDELVRDLATRVGLTLERWGDRH
jgi:hypothetical protein